VFLGHKFWDNFSYGQSILKKKKMSHKIKISVFKH